MLAAHEPGGTAYLIGAGGCGMSGLGHLLLDCGFQVAGSDLMVNEEIRQLRSRGAVIHQGHTAENLLNTHPFMAAYSSAIKSDNAELRAAQQTACPSVRRALVLAALADRQRAICVAGMHGKTTTSAWLAFALEQLGASPSYAIGSLTPQLQPHARFSKSAASWFVMETDESDGSLLYFHPEHAILLNVDEEHLDYFGTLESICQEFAQFCRQTRGVLVYCADDPRLARVVARHPRTISYGFAPDADYRVTLSPSPPMADAPGGAGHPRTRFEAWRGRELLGLFETRLSGEKNVSNAGAVIALLHQLGRAPAQIARAMQPFQGACRRQQLLFQDAHFQVYDDYGHHPREIEATLAALKPRDGRRLLVAFQPHRYTRTHHLMDQFATCFRQADCLWLTEIYAASEPPIPGIDGSTLAANLRAKGQAVEFIAALEDLPRAVRGAMQPGDVVLFLGAGDITQAAHSLAEALR